jgi:glycosyltransferase involved in cell wall biosynthesis
MHWTYPLPLRMRGWRNVYTVHDLIPLTRPDLTSIRPRTHRRILDAIVETDASIVTVSQTVQQEIVGTLALAPARVMDLSQAVLPPAPPKALPAGLVPREYYLFCGTIEPRKNIARLVAAHRNSGSTRPLVLAGPDGWRAEKVLAALSGFPLVRRLPYVERGTLTTLLMNARALLFPSLAEGFGLPIVEAMSLGTPVLTSAEGAMRETANGAALLVDPVDVEAIAAAIARLDTNEALCMRLRESGLARAGDFTVDAYARRLLTLYRRET